MHPRGGLLRAATEPISHFGVAVVNRENEVRPVVEGEVRYPRTVILEFPSREAFRAWYDSAEYQTILPLRLESTPGTLIVVNGL